jgi:hypothetical protein
MVRANTAEIVGRQDTPTDVLGGVFTVCKMESSTCEI